LRCRFVQFKLVADFLEARSESFNLLLLLCNGRLKALQSRSAEALDEVDRFACLTSAAPIGADIQMPK
jgi:hypothetical protein